MKNHSLLNKVITSIHLAKDKQALKFLTDEGEIIARCDADCCSGTWIEHIETPALGFPCRVVEVVDLDLISRDDSHPEHNCLQVYGLKIVTDKGEMVVDFRNASNGYYGGSLLFPEDGGFYGGVYGQNVSAEVWDEVSI